MAEKRRTKRKKFGYYMRVLDDRDQNVVGYLSDISPGGFKLDCQKEQKINQDFLLRMELTAEVANKNTMSFIARSKWCKRDPIEPLVFNVGFEIVRISQEDGAIFRRIMEKYGSQDNSTNLF